MTQISRAERMSHQTGDQWARKHDGYAVFLPDANLYFPSVRPTRFHAIEAWCNPTAWVENYEPRGFTVRPVTITEVKDDE